jgi:3-hydroxyisobutyrate dehydrogenase-like beta-hydroxyacid dehydrogenase
VKIVNNSVFIPRVGAPVMTVLGLGEAGARIAADLVAFGVEAYGYDPAATPTPKGVVRVEDPAAAAAESSVVLALTTGSTAFEAAESVLAGLGADTIYADLNSASPSLKRDLAVLFGNAGARFADVALLGPVPAKGLRTPALASGDGATAFAALLAPLGMPVEVVSDRAGDAATRKLLRSVFMKGLAASALESMRAADAAGAAEWLGREIGGVVGEQMLERLLEGSHRHAVRRVDELEAACHLLLELDVEPHVARASAAVLAELAATEGR